MRFVTRLHRGPEPDPSRDLREWLCWALFFTEPRAEVRECYAAWGCGVDGARGERIMKRALRVLERRHDQG